jgi:hypothetical protein
VKKLYLLLLSLSLPAVASAQISIDTITNTFNSSGGQAFYRSGGQPDISLVQGLSNYYVVFHVSGFAMANNGTNILATLFYDGNSLSGGAPNVLISSSSVIGYYLPNLSVGQHTFSIAQINSGTTAATSNTVTLSVRPRPNMTGIAPAVIAQNTAGATVTVQGTGFVSGSTVRWQTPAAVVYTLPGTVQTDTGGVVNGIAVNGSTVATPTAGGNATTLDGLLQIPGAATVSAIDQLGVPALLNGSVPAGNAGLSLIVGNAPSIAPGQTFSIPAGTTNASFTLQGTGFDGTTSATLTACSSAPAVAAFSATTLTLAVPDACLLTGGTLAVTVRNTVSGQVIAGANSAVLAVPLPAIVNVVSPAALYTGAGGSYALSVTGSNFVPGSVLYFGLNSLPTSGGALATTFVNSSRLTAVLPAGGLSGSGTANFIVVNAPGGNFAGTNSGTPVSLPVTSLTISTLTPAAAPVGSPSLSLIVTGTGFGNTSRVQWTPSGGTAVLLTPTAFTANSMTVTVSSSLLATAGTATIAAVDGVNISNTAPFAVNNFQIGSVVPASVPAGSGDTTVLITGLGFQQTAGVRLNAGVSLQTQFINANTLSALIPAANLATAASLSLTVFDTAQNIGTLPATFAVNAPGVTILTPNSSPVSPGSSLSIAVTGSYFLPTSSVVWLSGGVSQTLVSTFSGSGSLSAVVPGSLLTSGGTVLIAVSNGPGAQSNGVPFTVGPSPSLTAISPANTAAAGASFAMTLTGVNFTNGSSVIWTANGSATVLPASYNAGNSTLTAQIPANLVANPGTVTVAVQNPPAVSGPLSNSIPFTIGANATPVLTAIGPTSAASGGPAASITLTGTAFISGATAYWSTGSGSPTALNTIFIGATQLTAIAPAALLTGAGTAYITVSNPGGGSSSALPFAITPAGTVALTSVSPNTAAPGSQATQITVNGQNFVNGSVVQWTSGTSPLALSTFFVSATQLTAIVPANLLTAAGTAFVTVQNPADGTTGPLPFTIVTPAPVAPAIASLSPNTAQAGSAGFVMTITGSNFVSGSAAQWTLSSAQSLTTTFVDSGHLTAVVPAGLIAAAGQAFVSVINPGNVGSNLAGFTVAGAGAPTINPSGGIAPSQIVAGSGSISLTVNGANYVNGAVVNWTSGGGVTPLITGFGGAGQLTALVPAALLANPGTAFVTVQNPNLAVSNAATFTITSAPIPTVVSLTPNSATAGAPGFAMTITGTNFVSGATAQWIVATSQTLATTVVDGTHLTVVVPANLLATAQQAFVTVTNPGGVGSNLAPFTVNPPGLPAINTFSGISPSQTVAGSGAASLTVNGTNFVNGATVRWTAGSGLQGLSTGFINSTQLTAVIPANLLTAAGSAIITVQNPDGSVSNSATFVVTPAGQPSISSLSPTSVTTGGTTFQLTVNGSNFVNGAAILWTPGSGSAVTLTTSFVNSSTLIALVPANLIAASGSVFVGVTNPDHGTAVPASFTIATPTQPVITAATPASAQAGGAALQIAITGGNFLAGALAQWSTAGSTSQQLSTTFVSATQLTALIPATLIASSGSAFLSVANPNGTVSGNLPFAVTAPGSPSIGVNGGLTPSSAVAGSGAVTITVTGTNFVNGAIAYWNNGAGTQSNQALTTGFVSSTQVTAVVPAALLTSAGTALVTLQNPDQGTSNSATFTIRAAGLPALTSINPTAVTSGSGTFQLIVSGANFVSGSVVRWNAGATQSLVTSFIDSADLTAVVPASLTATAGSVFVSVVNPDGSATSPLSFTINPPATPSITQSNPAGATAGGGAFQISVTGSNFVSGSVLHWSADTSSGQALVTNFASATELTAVVPSTLISSVGTAFLTVVNPSGTVSGPLAFTVSAAGQPTINQTSGILPAATAAGSGAFSITLNGANFVNGAVVQWTGGAGVQLLATGFGSATQLTALIPASLVAAAGTALITVRNPNLALSNAATFTITAVGQPTIGLLSPSSGTAGGPTFQLAVTGTNYTSGSVVQWNTSGVPQTLSTVFISNTGLTAIVPASLIAAVGTAFITVVNPDQSTSIPQAFNINPAPQPAITSVTPSSTQAGGSALQIAITGANFVGSSTVRWGTGGTSSQTLATSYVSETQLIALVPASLIAGAGNAFLSVINPSGAFSTNVPFSITSPGQPSINIGTSGLSPSTAAAGSPAVTVSITGANFVNGASVLWSGSSGSQTLSAGFVSSTSLTAVIPAGLLTTAGTAFITVQNPDRSASNAAQFTVTQAVAPAITSVTPSTAVTGGTGFQLVLNGSNFVNGSVVQWTVNGGSPASLTTSYGGSTVLTALVASSLIASSGNVLIGVVNPSGAVSNQEPFSISPPAPPSITVISPVSIVAGASAVTLTLNGANFVNGAIVQWNSGAGAQSLTTGFGGPTSLTAVVPANLLTAAATVLVTVVNPDKGSSNAVVFTVSTAASPAITTLNPTTATAGAAGFQLTVNGSNFISGSVVTWTSQSGTRSLLTSFTDTGTLTALVPASLIAAAGNVLIGVQNPAGPVATPVSFTINSPAAPQLSSVAPASAVAGGGTVNVTVSGSNFVNGAVVQWNPNGTAQSLPTGFASSTSLTAVIPASLLANPGNAVMTVLNPDQSVSGSFTFTIVSPAAPLVTTLSPTSAIAGGAGFQLTVNGSNFSSAATVQWTIPSGGTQSLLTSFGNTGQLTALVPANLIANAGNVLVTVLNPNGGSSNSVPFAITAANAPQIVTVSPASAVAGSAATNLTVTGTNFVNGSVATWNSGSGAQNLATGFNSSTSLTVVVPANLLTSAGSPLMTVVNPDHSASNSFTFTVTAGAAPTISSLSPASATSGGAGFQLTVNGTNFASGAVVTWTAAGNLPQNLLTSFGGAGQLTALVTSALIANPGSVLINVVNPSGAAASPTAFTITSAPTPTISSLNPASATAGSAAVTLTVTGSNFVNGATVNWNAGSGAQPLTSGFADSSHMTAVVPASLLAGGGTALVEVINPDHGTSNVATFTVNPQGQPQITSLSPSTATSGGSAFQISVTGSSFVNGSTLLWTTGGTPVTLATTFVSATQLTGLVPANLIANTGNVFLSVSNPPGGVLSNSVQFAVTGPVVVSPAIVSVNPASVQAGASAQQLSVSGSGFVNGAIVLWNSGSSTQQLVTSFVSSTLLNAVVPANYIASGGIVFLSVQNPGPVLSNLFPFTISIPGGPTVTSLTPATAPAASATQTIVIAGTNFQNGAVVQWNSGSGAQSLTTGFTSSTQLTAIVPAALLANAGTAFVTVVNPDRNVSNTTQFLVTSPQPPTIASSNGLTPATVLVGSASFQLTVTGTNFASGAVVNWIGSSGTQPLTTAFVSSTAVTALVPASYLTSANSVLVSVANPGGATSNLTPFSVVSASQAVLSSNGLVPSSAAAGSSSVTVSISGNNFVNGSTVQWNANGGAQPLTTGYVNSTQLNAVIPALYLTTPGTAFITIVNPDRSVSNSLSFTVTGSVPAITGLSPNSAAAGGSGVSLTVTGSGFSSGTTITWNLSPIPTSVVSSTQLTAVVSAALVANPGIYTVQAQNGAGTSNTLTFSVGAPTIAALSPSTATTGAPAFTLTVSGTNFLQGATVYWGSTALSTTYIGGTQLLAAVPGSLLAAAGAFNITVLNPGAVSSASMPFAVGASPIVASLSPNAAPPGSSGFTLTVNGSNFTAGDTVLWNGAPLSTSYVSSTQLTAPVTAAQLSGAGTVNVSVLHNGVLSNTVAFGISAPAVTSVSPSTAPAGSPSLPIVVTGTNFISSSQVQWNGTPLGTSFSSATQLNAQIDSSLMQTPGTNFLTVVNGTTQSAAARFIVTGPTLTSLNPAAATAGASTALTLFLTGTNFVNGSVAVWNGTNLTTTFGSSIQLTAQVPPNLLSTAGAVLVQVTNPGGASSGTVAFTLNPPAASTIASVSPVLAVAGGPAFLLTVSGTGYAAGSTILWNGQPLPTSFVSATQLTALVDSGLLLAAGTANLSVQTPSAPLSATAKFPINGPTIVIVSPNTAPAGAAGFTLSVTGTNFLSGSSILWNGSAVATQYVSATQLTAAVPASFVTAAGAVKIVVQNAAGAVSNAADFTIGPFTLNITTGSLSDAVIGQAYSAILNASGGTGPYTWSLSGGQLPQGLTLDPNTGTIAGVPSASISTTISITVADSVNRTLTKVFPFRTVQQLGIGNTSPLPPATFGTGYSVTLNAAGGSAPYNWSIQNGALPPGLTLNGSTGQISGIPVTPGVFQFTAACQDSRSQSVSAPFTATVTVTGVSFNLPAQAGPAQSLSAGLQLGGPYPVDISGTVTMTFAASALQGDDPAIVFSTGGRTANFTLPANTQQPLFGGSTNLQIASTGTVAGTIGVKASSIRTPTGDVTPAPPPGSTIAIPKQAPVITGVTLSKVTGGVNVEIRGYSTTREVSQAAFLFTAAAGSNLVTSSQVANVTALFNTWYSSTGSAQYGSQFVVDIPFPITGDLSAIGGVTVTLTNSVGTSTGVSAPLQ